MANASNQKAGSAAETAKDKPAICTQQRKHQQQKGFQLQKQNQQEEKHQKRPKIQKHQQYQQKTQAERVKAAVET